MPSNYAHYVFGKEVFKMQSSKVKQIIKHHKELYLIGLHGPDIFFYYEPFSKNTVNQMGNDLHDRSGFSFFAPAADIIRKQKHAPDTGISAEALTAYILGFLCHFSLDTCCHGYIEKKMAVSHLSHIAIETEFDRRLLVKDGFSPYKHRLTSHIRPSGKVSAHIACFFPEVSKKQVSISLKTMIFCDKLLLTPNRLKRSLISNGMRLFGCYENFHDLVMKEKPDPRCIDSNMRLEKLMQKAIPLCLSLTESFLSYLEESNTLDVAFTRTFGPDNDWKSIPVYEPSEEQHYEI